MLWASEPNKTTPESSFRYDGAGRMVSRTDAAGTSTFGYDDRGDLWRVTDAITGQVSEFSRDATGAVTQVRYGTSAVRQYSYDGRGFVVSDVLRAGSTVRASYTYTYDAEGNLTGQQVVMPGNAAAGTHRYTYDRVGRLASWTKPSGSTVTYAYDRAGNRVRAGQATFTYDERNRLVSGPDGTYTWSARGTLVSGRSPSGAALAYTFDALGRQTKVGSVAYQYDGLDRVVKRAGTTVRYAGVEIDPVAYGTSELYARSAAGELVAARRGSARTFVGENRHGDIGWYAGTNGTLWGSAVYGPWGEATTSGSSTLLGFQGDVTDPASGDVWMGARWYDPDTAGFTARDSMFGVLRTPVSLNRYTYAANDPLEFFDPDGRRFCETHRRCERPSPPGGWRDRSRPRSGGLRSSIAAVDQEALQRRPDRTASTQAIVARGMTVRRGTDVPAQQRYLRAVLRQLDRQCGSLAGEEVELGELCVREQLDTPYFDFLRSVPNPSVSRRCSASLRSGVPGPACSEREMARVIADEDAARAALGITPGGTAHEWMSTFGCLGAGAHAGTGNSAELGRSAGAYDRACREGGVPLQLLTALHAISAAPALERAVLRTTGLSDDLVASAREVRTPTRVVIGGMEDLRPGSLQAGEETLASRLPADTRSRLGNWLNNRDALRAAMREGVARQPHGTTLA